MCVYVFGQENRIFLATRSVCGLKYAENAIAGGARDAPPDPLVGWVVDTPPHTPPHSAPLIVVPP